MDIMVVKYLYATLRRLCAPSALQCFCLVSLNLARRGGAGDALARARVREAPPRWETLEPPLPAALGFSCGELAAAGTEREAMLLQFVATELIGADARHKIKL